MSKLLDLATGFEESSRQQLKNSNEALRIALQEHETFIKNSLMASAQNISGDMASQNEQLQQQSAALMQTYQTILTQHSQQLAEMEQAFIQQNTAFKEKIRQSEKNLYRLAARPLLWVVIGGLMGVFLMMVGIGLWLAMDKNEKLQASIQEQTQVLQQLQKDTHGIQIINCQLDSGGTVPCVAVDPTAPAWGKNGEYRAILPKKD